MRRGGSAVALLAWLVSLPVGAAPPAAEDFVLYCSGCHGPEGAGTPGVVPPLSGLAPFLESDAGRAYLVRVPGVAQSSLDDERLAALLNWVLREFSGVVAAPRYTADEVGDLRSRPLRDPERSRERALHATRGRR